MSSTSEYEQQRFWKNNSTLPEGWITKYIDGIKVTFNERFLETFYSEKPNNMAYKPMILNFNTNEK